MLSSRWSFVRGPRGDRKRHAEREDRSGYLDKFTAEGGIIISWIVDWEHFGELLDHSQGSSSLVLKRLVCKRHLLR